MLTHCIIKSFVMIPGLACAAAKQLAVGHQRHIVSTAFDSKLDREEHVHGKAVMFGARNLLAVI